MPTQAPAPVTTPRLTALTDAIRAVVRQDLPPQETSELVAERLRPFLAQPDLVPDEYLRGDPGGYTQHLLHAEDDGSFSIVALVWLPGQQTPVHDHVAWCVTGVHLGAEQEDRYEIAGPPSDRFLLPAETAVNDTGSVCGFAPPGDIHRVRNSGSGLAVSLHIYGADISRLGTSIRREYRLPVRTRAELS
ncbi:cysteine dioxygenase family protein [Streptomyces sp. NPDC003077]|uniref:cysteine dioxygenase family protein n=1 Tax=Streptomyces sp. NPDC003077 TaxID=3154443 RepID=UPI0033A4A28E